jgi:hypothetical protein
MLHGGCDATCAASVAKEALEAMSSRDKTWVLMADAKHDLELDLWRDDWFAYVSEWMNRQVVKIKQVQESRKKDVVGVKRDRQSFLSELTV